MTKTKGHLFVVSLATAGPFCLYFWKHIWLYHFALLYLWFDYKELGLPYKARQFDKVLCLLLRFGTTIALIDML